MKNAFLAPLLPFFLGLLTTLSSAQDIPPNFATDKLVAWCIVPFDAKQRGPAERAAMLNRLGLTRCAYDWRKPHVAEFEEEIVQYKKHEIDFFAFWNQHETAFELFQKHGIHPQVWKTVKKPFGNTHAERVEVAAQSMVDLAKTTEGLGCRLGLYNHGGWSGNPTNLVAVVERLHKLSYLHVGIVYNWHHGHDRFDTWKTDFARMKPYLHCLNLNGMNPAAKPKILTLGQGKHDAAMLATVLDSGYKGPIGILDHQFELDAEIALQDNLYGLEWLLKEWQVPGSGGIKPVPKAKPLSPAPK